MRVLLGLTLSTLGRGQTIPGSPVIGIQTESSSKSRRRGIVASCSQMSLAQLDEKFGASQILILARWTIVSLRCRGTRRIGLRLFDRPSLVRLRVAGRKRVERLLLRRWLFHNWQGSGREWIEWLFSARLLSSRLRTPGRKWIQRLLFARPLPRDWLITGRKWIERLLDCCGSRHTRWRRRLCCARSCLRRCRCRGLQLGRGNIAFAAVQ